MCTGASAGGGAHGSGGGGDMGACCCCCCRRAGDPSKSKKNSGSGNTNSISILCFVNVGRWFVVLGARALTDLHTVNVKTCALASQNTVRQQPTRPNNTAKHKTKHNKKQHKWTALQQKHQEQKQKQKQNRASKPQKTPLTRVQYARSMSSHRRVALSSSVRMHFTMRA